MASDKVKFETAFGRWSVLRDESNFSVPDEQGKIAVVCPFFDEADYAYDEPDDERYDALKNEALTVADEIMLRGRDVHVAEHASIEDFRQVLAEPNISSIVVVGSGCLSSVQIANPAMKNRVDWFDLSTMTDHLKTGTFTQRMCGTLPRSLNVPLGLLTVNDHRNLLGAPGKILTTRQLNEYADRILLPVTDEPVMSYESINAQFPQRRLSTISRVHVALGSMKRAVRGLS